jgi:ubiquinone/menaquinone biosynthesis C-methylase UbiE
LYMDNTAALYNKLIHEYKDYKLYPSEHIIFGKFDGKWPNIKMLDIGVGTGRTTFTFAPITKHYTGIDYAEAMLQQCQKILPANINTTLAHCDARDLSRFYNQKFDFVMFSLNGIDSVNHSDRLKILAEVKKVLSKDGFFFFSTHSLRAFSNFRSRPKFKWYSPVKSLYHLLRNIMFNRRMKSFYKDSDVQEIQQCDWKILKTGDHDFKIDVYHIDPVVQIQHLDEIGFQVESIYGLYGGIENPETTQVNTLNYLCKLKPDAEII